MIAHDLRIEPKTEGRGRTFRASLLAAVDADPLWEAGRTAGDTHRPILAVLAGSDAELRAFVANLQTGRKAVLGTRGKDRLELLKSVGYEYFTQRHPEGAITTAYLPELLDLDPGMVDPTGARFVCAPRRDWLRANPVPDLDAVVAHAIAASDQKYDFRDRDTDLYQLAPVACLFAAYLDRRTRCPIVADPRFYLQVLLASLREGLAKLAVSWDGYERDSWLKAFGTAEMGFAEVVGFCASHESVERLLAAETTRYFDLVESRRPHRVPALRSMVAE